VFSVKLFQASPPSSFAQSSPQSSPFSHVELEIAASDIDQNATSAVGTVEAKRPSSGRSLISTIDSPSTVEFGNSQPIESSDSLVIRDQGASAQSRRNSVSTSRRSTAKKPASLIF
jgi:hypothetical protein